VHSEASVSDYDQNRHADIRHNGLSGVVVINDERDPGLLLPRAVDCPADESKGGAVADLAARNASNPGNGGRLAARTVGSPVVPKYGSSSIGGAAAFVAAFVELALVDPSQNPVSLASSSSSLSSMSSPL